MNVRDSEIISGLLTTSGYRLTNNPEEADVVILNTCSVRQHAEDRVWSAIGRYSKGHQVIRSPGRQKIIGLIGCMAQNYKEAVFERSPQVDFVVGPADIHKIPKIINELAGRRKSVARKIWETGNDRRPEAIYQTGFFEDKNHRFVVISEGCSNFCSYCIVPYVRGALCHRKQQDILNEIRSAIEQGVAKVTLLGQNVNSYRDEGTDFIGLIKSVNSLKGLTEFSFVTSHPKDTSLELFKAMQEAEKLKKNFHLPVQSGSDRILKAMNRGYSRKFYLELAHNYRTIVKGGSLTTDIIVGFPGETKKDFQDTFNLVKKIAFNAAYIFKYSPRPNTEALKLKDDVENKEKELRHGLILELQKEISRTYKKETG